MCICLRSVVLDLGIFIHTPTEIASEMAHDTNWDVEALRSPHEPQHQWELRRSFMEKHKKDIPKDRLVCLAQTLANMEFMGCRYPQDTMDQVCARSNV